MPASPDSCVDVWPSPRWHTGLAIQSRTAGLHLVALRPAWIPLRTAATLHIRLKPGSHSSQRSCASSGARPCAERGAPRCSWRRTDEKWPGEGQVVITLSRRYGHQMCARMPSRMPWPPNSQAILTISPHSARAPHDVVLPGDPRSDSTLIIASCNYCLLHLSSKTGLPNAAVGPAGACPAGRRSVARIDAKGCAE